MRLRFTNRRVIADREYHLSELVAALNHAMQRQCVWTKLQTSVDQTEPSYRLLISAGQVGEIYVLLLSGDYAVVIAKLQDYLNHPGGMDRYNQDCAAAVSRALPATT